MSCVVCGAPTALSVYRCATCRRPAFYGGRVSEELASRRGGHDASLPGEPRAPSGQTLKGVAAAARAECRRRGGGSVREIADAISAGRDVVACALSAGVRGGQFRRVPQGKSHVRYVPVGA